MKYVDDYLEEITSKMGGENPPHKPDAKNDDYLEYICANIHAIGGSDSSITYTYEIDRQTLLGSRNVYRFKTETNGEIVPRDTTPVDSGSLRSLIIDLTVLDRRYNEVLLPMCGFNTTNMFGVMFFNNEYGDTIPANLDNMVSFHVVPHRDIILTRVQIPSNATKMVFTMSLGLYDTPDNITDYTTIEFTYDEIGVIRNEIGSNRNEIVNIRNEIANIRNDLDDISDRITSNGNTEYEYNLSNGLLTDGVFRFKTEIDGVTTNPVSQTVVSSGACRSMVVNLEEVPQEYETVTVPIFSTNSANLYGVVFFSEETGNTLPSNLTNMISYVLGGQPYTQVEEVTIPIPENATKMVFTMANGMYNTPNTISDYSSIKFGFIDPLQDVYDRIDEIDNRISGKNVDIHIAKTIYAVVGDTLQLFYKSFIEGDLNNYIIKFACSLGRNYPRYWECTPLAENIGNYPIGVAIYDLDGNEVAKAQSQLVVCSPVNPSSPKNVLCMGASIMSPGTSAKEASRRLKGTSGSTPTTPAPLNLTNFNFVGRKQLADGSVGWEGTGGYTYTSYTTAGSKGVRFFVDNAQGIEIDRTYTLAGFDFDISEINVTNGSGNIKCIFKYTTPYNSSFEANAPSSGYLVQGSSQIHYTSYELEMYQPFWNYNTNEFDIVSYVNRYCNGTLDYIFISLGLNTVIGRSPFDVRATDVDAAKTFYRNIHSVYPNCKILIGLLTLASCNGGIAANYVSGAESGMYSANGFAHKIHLLNDLYKEVAEDPEFSDYLVIVDTCSQVDIENVYPSTTKPVNTRMTDVEKVETNGVHFGSAGYYQLADTIFRALICLNQ